MNNSKCNCGSSVEDARHFFFECPLYTDQRHRLKADLSFIPHIDLNMFATYNVLLRYLAFVSRCYSLLPIMLKIFDVICQLADDFYEKGIFFPHFSRILSLQVRQSLSLLLVTICKWQFSVNGQIFFNRADKNKSTVRVLCLIFFRPSFII